MSCHVIPAHAAVTMSEDLPDSLLRYFWGTVEQADHFVKYSYHFPLTTQSLWEMVSDIQKLIPVIPHSH